jgi:hypothetical protein
MHLVRRQRAEDGERLHFDQVGTGSENRVAGFEALLVGGARHAPGHHLNPHDGGEGQARGGRQDAVERSAPDRQEASRSNQPTALATETAPVAFNGSAQTAAASTSVCVQRFEKRTTNGAAV